MSLRNDGLPPPEVEMQDHGFASRGPFEPGSTTRRGTTTTTTGESHEYSKTDRQADRQTDRQADSKADRQTDRQTARQTDRQTDRQADRQTDRQTDRQRQIIHCKLFHNSHCLTNRVEIYLRGFPLSQLPFLCVRHKVNPASRKRKGLSSVISKEPKNERLFFQTANQTNLGEVASAVVQSLPFD